MQNFCYVHSDSHTLVLFNDWHSVHSLSKIDSGTYYSWIFYFWKIDMLAILWWQVGIWIIIREGFSVKIGDIYIHLFFFLLFLSLVHKYPQCSFFIILFSSHFQFLLSLVPLIQYALTDRFWLRLQVKSIRYHRLIIKKVIFSFVFSHRIRNCWHTVCIQQYQSFAWLLIQTRRTRLFGM